MVPELFTPEPAESYSRADLDEYSEIIRQVAEEAYFDPQVVTTWRVWKRLNPEG